MENRIVCLNGENAITSKIITSDHFKLDKNERIALALLIAGVALLILKMFDISTLLFIAFILVGLALFIKERLKKIKQFGIINLLPESIRYFLINKSLLDMLMDFWHLSVLGDYLQLIFSPIIYGYSPEESQELVNKLEGDLHNALTTKVSTF